MPVIFPPQFCGRKWLHHFYRRLALFALSAGEPHAHKIPHFRGVGLFFGGGGAGRAIFIFMGAGIFLIKLHLLKYFL